MVYNVSFLFFIPLTRKAMDEVKSKVAINIYKNNKWNFINLSFTRVGCFINVQFRILVCPNAYILISKIYDK